LLPLGGDFCDLSRGCSADAAIKQTCLLFFEISLAEIFKHIYTHLYQLLLALSLDFLSDRDSRVFYFTHVLEKHI